MQVDFPVGFGVGGKRQIFAGLFAGHAGGDSLLVKLAGARLKFRFRSRKFRSGIIGQGFAAALAVAGGLRSPSCWRGGLRGIDRQRVACAVFVHVRSAVANPLPPAVHGHAHQKFDLGHFERRGVAVPHQVAN